MVTHKIRTRTRVQYAFKNGGCRIIRMSQQQVGLHQQTCCRVYRGYAHWEFPLKHYFLQILCRKRPFGVIYSLQNGKTLTRLPQLARLQVGLQSLGNILLYVLKFGQSDWPPSNSPLVGRTAYRGEGRSDSTFYILHCGLPHFTFYILHFARQTAHSERPCAAGGTATGVWPQPDPRTRLLRRARVVHPASANG